MAVDGSNKLGNVGSPSAARAGGVAGAALSSSEIAGLLGDIAKVSLDLPRPGDYVTQAPQDKLAMNWTAANAAGLAGIG